MSSEEHADSLAVSRVAGYSFRLVSPPPTSQATLMTLRRFVAAALAAAAVVGCSDPVGLRADRSVITEGLTVYAHTGTPPSFPSALYSPQPAVVRPTGSFAFDIVFDIDAAGKVVLYPVQLVGDVSLVGRRVGMLRSSTPFADLRRAPDSGYQFDSAFVINPRETVALIAPHGGQEDICFGNFISTDIFSKVMVDSVNVADRLIYFKVTVDPNCGFKSFETGIPKF